MTGNVEAERGLRLVIAGGGTGGHLYPAIAIAEAFQQRVPKCECVFIGTAQNIEARVLPRQGYRMVAVPARGLQRRLTPANLLVPVRLWQSIQICQRLFREFQPQLVIGTGGYVSVPALLAAWWSGRKFVVQEQNSLPGLANRWIGKQADAVFLSFEESRKYFKNRKRLHVVGNPLRANLQERTAAKREAAAAQWQLRTDCVTLLVFGGSLGARRINEVMLALLPDLASISTLQVLWATGPAHFESIAPQAGAYERVRAVPYVDDMNLAYALADFAFCRSGSSIFELALCGLPAILLPFPFATADHQTHNARAFEKAGAARLFVEDGLNQAEVYAAIRDLATDAELRRRMSERARQLAKPHAAQEIVATCLRLIN